MKHKGLLQRGTHVWFVALLLLFVAAGQVSAAYTVLVATDGVERTTSYDLIREYGSDGTLVQDFSDPFPESHLRWSDMQLVNGTVYTLSHKYTNTYTWNYAGLTYDGTKNIPGGGKNLEPQDSTFSPDGTKYLVMNPATTRGIQRFEFPSGTWVDKFITPDATSAGFCYGPDGNVYIADTAGWIRRYDGTTGAKIDDWTNVSGGLRKLQWHDGFLYAAAYGLSGNEIYKIDPTTGAPTIYLSTDSITGADMIRDFAWAPDGELVVSTTNNLSSAADYYLINKIYRFDAATGALLGEIATLPEYARPDALIVIPEPATMSLVLLGLPMVIRRRR
ncbi:MAG: hypothetical protein JXA11_11500 [Phycisphaerae bacterium]|nr:hypothetical protein [Phycisphaerae bacterium]